MYTQLHCVYLYNKAINSVTSVSNRQVGSSYRPENVSERSIETMHYIETLKCKKKVSPNQKPS